MCVTDVVVTENLVLGSSPVGGRHSPCCFSRHIEGSCALVRRPTVQTAAWSSTWPTKTTGRMTVAPSVRESKGLHTNKLRNKVTNSPPYRRINKSTDLHTLDWNHVWPLKTGLVLYPNIRDWNGGKPKMEAPGWGFQEDMTMQCCNYMCRNALWIIICADTHCVLVKTTPAVTKKHTALHCKLPQWEHRRKTLTLEGRSS